MLSKDDYDRLNEAYVKHAECNEKHCELNKRLAETSTTITVLSHDLNAIKKVLYVIASGIGISVLDRILELVLR